MNIVKRREVGFPEADACIERGDLAGALEALKRYGIEDDIYKPKGERQHVDELFAGISSPPTREELDRIARIILGPGWEPESAA